MDSLKVRAIRFEQNRRVFYIAVMSAGEAIARSAVDVWDADVSPDVAGYQRAPSTARLRDMASFIEEDDSVLPLGGLLNARSGNGAGYGEVLDFRADAGEESVIQSGWLTIPASKTPLYIVDMQHRLLGLKLAIEADGRDDLRDFPVVITIADGLPKLEEVKQFEVINTNQKKVRTDLARRLMSIQVKDPSGRIAIDRKGRLWEARGPVVADWLNRHGKIWKNRILPPNKTKSDMPRAIVRETSFVTSLKPILQTPLFQRMSEEQVATVIDRYWEALADTFALAFSSPEDYVIQKTPGIFSLHALAPEVIEIVRTSTGELNRANMAKVIDGWIDLGPEFWARDNEGGAARYGSMKGFSRLAAELRTYLPPLELPELLGE